MAPSILPYTRNKQLTKIVRSIPRYETPRNLSTRSSTLFRSSPRLFSIQSFNRAKARFERLCFATLSRWSERNLSIIFTVRQKRNLLVDKNRPSEAESGSQERGRDEHTKRRHEERKREMMAPGDHDQGTLSPRLFPLLRHITSRLDETRPSHVTLNWSIIWQSSCPNRRRSQSKEASRLSVPDNRGVFLDKGHHVIQKYSTLLPGLTKKRRGLGRMKS